MTRSVFSWEKISGLLREDGVAGTLRLACRHLYGLAHLWYLRHVVRAHETVCRVHDYRMITMANGQGIARELITVGNHEKTASRELQRRLKPAWHVVDLGANIGYYALMEAMGVGPTGKVFALEPVPDNYDLLVRNVALNKLRNIVETHRLAIGDRDGEVPMKISTAMNRHTFLSLEPESIAGTMPVPMLTFERFVREYGVCLDRLRLVRMDIEGYEAVVLPDIVAQLRGRDGVSFQVEFHPSQMASVRGGSFAAVLLLLKSVTDGFEWLLGRRGHRKLLFRHIPIDEVLASKELMGQPNLESWFTIRGC